MKIDPHKSQSYLPDIFTQMNIIKSDPKYIIQYPKPELMCLAERENKVIEWSNRNKAIIDRLTCKRYPLNYFAEMEKAVFSQRLSVRNEPELPIEKSICRRKVMYSPSKSIKQIEHMVKFDKGIKNEEIDRMLIQKPVVIYYKRIKSY